VAGRDRTKMARPAGLEPTTTGLEGRCSIQLSYGRAKGMWSIHEGDHQPDILIDSFGTGKVSLRDFACRSPSRDLPL
jgi:hypothetical protein